MKITVINYSLSNNYFQNTKVGEVEFISQSITPNFTRETFVPILSEVEDFVAFVDADRISFRAFAEAIVEYLKVQKNGCIGYYGGSKSGLILKSFSDTGLYVSPFYIGKKETFLKTSPDENFPGGAMSSLGYMLKQNGERFCPLSASVKSTNVDAKKISAILMFYAYYIKMPISELISGRFFVNLLNKDGQARRESVWKFFMLLFAIFTFVIMPYLSFDYGVSGDEFVDHRHAGYVLDFYTKGDNTAVNQPETYLHFYGNSVQVVAAAICRWFDIDNYYEVRHVVCSLVGALGILFVGLLGARLGGGICGLIAMILMFLTPRYFGHSMNNLKDIPFAVGYLVSIYYIIRLFDRYPRFRLREICGVAIGIGLTLGTRSGGLILYPMMLMYGGLFYIQYYGISEFYKFGKYVKVIGRILKVLILAGLFGYILAILLWPYALQNPVNNVVYSLKMFTHFSIGLRTIFDGEQMMSTMLPWRYAPKYLMIGVPIVTVIGFFAYALVLLIHRKKFTLNTFFVFAAAIIPVFWVSYKNSNLYGGIRHMLFIMPIMVIIAALFWNTVIKSCSKYLKVLAVVLFLGLVTLPAMHMIRNHPNQYVYFNEFVGGIAGTYGDYETDYYFNSMKASAEWLKKNMVRAEGRKTIIATQHLQSMQYYFRHDTTVRVIYTRYYEKYSKDWDYAIFANVYVNKMQLKNGIFPPQKCLYAPDVDGYPMSVVLQRPMHDDYEAFKLEKENKYPEAIAAFEALAARDGELSEEAWGRLCKLYYITNNTDKCIMAAEKALALHPTLNEALSIGALNYLRDKQYENAHKYVARILAENATSPEAHFIRASIYAEQKKYQNAIEDLNETLRYRPTHAGALSLAADIMFKAGRYPQAFDLYQKVMKIQASADIFVNMANTLCKLNNTQQAEVLLQKVMEVKSNFQPAQLGLIRLHIAQNQLDEAAKILAVISVRDAEFHYLNALYLQKSFRINEAVEEINEAVKLGKDDFEVKQLMNQLKK